MNTKKEYKFLDQETKDGIIYICIGKGNLSNPLNEKYNIPDTVSIYALNMNSEFDQIQGYYNGADKNRTYWLELDDYNRYVAGKDIPQPKRENKSEYKKLIFTHMIQYGEVFEISPDLEISHPEHFEKIEHVENNVFKAWSNGIQSPVLYIGKEKELVFTKHITPSYMTGSQTETSLTPQDYKIVYNIKDDVFVAYDHIGHSESYFVGEYK